MSELMAIMDHALGMGAQRQVEGGNAAMPFG
jgi:hypothetical protein